MALITRWIKLFRQVFVQGQMSLDIVLGQSIIPQQLFARISRGIAISLGKYKREVKVKGSVKVS